MYREMKPVPCTKCGYCMPCPNGIDIPGNFEEYNDGVAYGDLRGARLEYARFFDKKKRASACKKCGRKLACARACGW